MGRQSREKREKRAQENQSQERIAFVPNNPLERIYLAIIEIGVYFALLSPFITNKNYFFPYVSPKTIFFRIIIDVILIAYVLLVIANRKYLPRINILIITLTVFLAVSILASFTGIDFNKSFWSTFERMTGILTLLHLFTFFVILAGVFKERKHWERILTVSIIIGVLVAFNALVTRNETSQTGGTIGNISFLAAYLLFDMFFAMILFFTRKGWRKILYGLSLIIMFLPLFATPEFPRGFFGAFISGLFLLAIGYMVFSKNQLLKKIAPIAFVLTIFAAVFLIQTPFFKSTFMDIKYFPGEARKVVWQMGFEAWQERPWLGWGLENFNIPFAKHFSSSLPPTGDVWYDRVHNIILDTLVDSGIVGLASYLAIFGAGILKLLKTIPKIKERRNLFFPLGMIVLLIVYFIQNFFVFDMVSSYLVFFLALGFINFLISYEESEIIPLADRQFNRAFSFIGSLLIIVSIASIYFGNIQPARASKLIIKGLTAPLDKSISAFQSALAASPIAQYEASEQFSRRVGPLAFDQNQDRVLVDQAFELSIKELEKTIAKTPADFRLYLLLGRHYNDFFNQTQDGEKLKLAEKFLSEAIKLSPKNQQGYWSLAQVYLFQGRSGEAYQALQKAIDLEPRYGQSHWYLAMAYKANEDNDLARQEVVRAKEVLYSYDWTRSMEDLKKVIEIYQNFQDDAALFGLYQIATQKDPKDAQLWAGLAVTQANLKKYPEARVSAQKALELKPDFASKLEEFLKDLPQ